MEKEDGGLTKVIAKTQYIINNTMNYPESFKKGFIKEIEKELNQCEIIYNPNTKGIWLGSKYMGFWMTGFARPIELETEPSTTRDLSTKNLA